MVVITKNPPALQNEIDDFLSKVDFSLPSGLIEFYSESNGVKVITDDAYAIVWPLEQLFKLNDDYCLSEFAPEYFLFGSNGGGSAFDFEKANGKIYEMPFIGMSKDEAEFKSENFPEFISSFK
jgi:hypothetical protein